MPATDAGLFGNGLRNRLLRGLLPRSSAARYRELRWPVPDASWLAVNCIFAGRTAEILIDGFVRPV